MFGKGDKVVYPHHGAAVIEDLVEREVFGERRTYFKLRLAHGDLTLMVPDRQHRGSWAARGGLQARGQEGVRSSSVRRRP